MCALLLTHPRAHTPGAVDTHTPGAVDTQTHTHLEQWTHTHLEQWTHTHTWSSGHTHRHTHLEQWAHTHTHTPGAVNAVAPGEQLGVRCLAQGSHLSRGQFLPEPRTHNLRLPPSSDSFSASLLHPNSSPLIYFIPHQGRGSSLGSGHVPGPEPSPRTASQNMLTIAIRLNVRVNS